MGDFGLPFFLSTIMSNLTDAQLASRLPAVNLILASCGQAPVTTLLDQTNPEVTIVNDTLSQVSKEVQSEGWTFNTEDHSHIEPDTNDHILIADNQLQVKLNSETPANFNVEAAIRRDINDGLKKLYNKTDHKFEWTATEVICDIVYEYEWRDLPIPIQNYVTSRAAAITSSKIIGDPTQYQMLQQQEAYTRSFALEYEANQGKHTFFGHPQGAKHYNSYQPFQALRR